MIEKGQHSQPMRKKIQQYSFYINQAIGQGYSSRVYKGKNDLSNEPVAIKVIDMKMLKQSINKQLLKSQIQTLKLFEDSQYILNLNAVYTTKNNTYIITELCSNDLGSVIKKKLKLTEAQAMKYMKEIIAAYKQIYEHKIIHRDLKPANILITEQNKTKLADFGFAIKQQNVHTQTTYNVGSPIYMPLEALKNTDYSYKSDIWALGIIYYEMLFGRVPWKGKNEKDLLRKIETQQIDINNLNISKISKLFLEKTLKKDKHHRIQPEELINFNFIEILPINRYLTPNNMDKSIYRQYSARYRSPRNVSFNKMDQSKTLESEYQIKFVSPKKDTSLSVYNKKQMQCSTKINQKNTIVDQMMNQKRNKFSQKVVTKILISQVHFARFLFKLLARILQSYDKGILKQSKEIQLIERCYIKIIKQKLQSVKNFGKTNFICIQDHQQYATTKACINLEKIASDYMKKYSKELTNWNDFECELPASKPTNPEYSKQFNKKEQLSQQNISCIKIQPTQTLIKFISQKLLATITNQSEIKHHKNQIIILDYLMTSRQLLKLAQGGDYFKFSKKSRIEQIVQGTLTEISYSIYCKIISKSVKVINSFIGKETQNEQVLYN